MNRRMKARGSGKDVGDSLGSLHLILSLILKEQICHFLVGHLLFLLARPCKAHCAALLCNGRETARRGKRVRAGSASLALCD